MKTIGLLGGMSWESTALYYRLLNEGIGARVGGLHSACIAMRSVDFADYAELQHAGDWVAIGERLSHEARRVESAGAELLLIATNTMHRVYSDIQAAVDIPVLHIADATGEALRAAGVKRAGLLGTAFTMEQDFYSGRLRDRFDIEVIVPDAEQRKRVHRVIFEELVRGEVSNSSRQDYLAIIDSLSQRGAECVIEGCTEIVLLVQQQHTPVPLFDTTALHVAAALEQALND